ncbi:MAG: NADH-quinone oxidoreductase subunit M [Chthoniobacterales bacterium]|nr:NADH-quinone oxidoreductase subunit M [Chthoniobacterales bacterium]MCX7713621.1 NADH-quinone oxidoreductase subunit M [Chthoniobacterales bacterium]
MIPFLFSLILVPFLSALGTATVRNITLARTISLVGGFTTLALALRLCAPPPACLDTRGLAYSVFLPWLPQIGIEFSLGIDSLNRLFALLSPFVTLLALLALNPSSSRWLAANLLWLESALLGNFCAQNFGTWFLFYELSLAPAFFLIRSPGDPNASRAALRFFLYTQAGGIAILAGYLAIGLSCGTFSFPELAHTQISETLNQKFAIPWLSNLIFWLVLGGLMIKIPAIPLHGWLPETYSRAPAVAIMILTGVMSKMGLYGILRLLSPVFPRELSQWAGILLWLAVAGAVFAAFVAITQSDLRRAFGYLSINHLAYCLMGIFSFHLLPPGTSDKTADLLYSGVLLLAFNHGISAATLFAILNALEERTAGKHSITDFGGLRSLAPVLSGLGFISIFASLGLPGLNGFPGEFLLFVGVFHVSWPAATLASLALLLGAFFLLNVIQRVFWGPIGKNLQNFPEIRPHELLWAVPAAAAIVVLGIWPQAILNLLRWP